MLVLALMGLIACAEHGADNGDVPPVPENVEGPPPEAEQSDSGLAWIVLSEGQGDRHPRPEDQITVHYSGWQTDGEMFDSSVVRGEPNTFPLGQLIEGWVEGLQLMTEGEKRRFWIPGELAYDERPDRPDAPKGMLVFDVELIEIHDQSD
ncbi:FKBP-type peptidyl-prolyl cis-trans isomerase [Gammaproteobacteria bacterium AB-CW1]|uniref:Peptidyl-prolyl cis-trans isomerase n=1 Tax=Natronospira elongata TaxID=3110268 RepID=A0AAP6JFG4_9GAMM|nr:FKBP-type peptidyl-prolyl cis-trans isomerase [Gammaproteobacteria bacterium AB-CW1]